MRLIKLVIFFSLCFSLNSQTLPQLRSVDCWRTGMPMSQVLYANPTGGLQYKFKVKNLNTGVTDSLISADRAFSISELPSVAKYNCSYQVNVKIDMGSGFGPWGSTCTVSIAPLISNLRSVDCPKNLLAINSPVYSNALTADYWDFQVRRADDTTIVANVFNRPNRELSLSMISSPDFQQSQTQYQVRVRTSQGGILQPWGYWCSIFTPANGPQIIQGCGDTLKLLAYEWIKCSNITGATQYDFQLRYGSNLVTIKSTNVDSARLADFYDPNTGVPYYNYGVKYRISARALVNGVWTAWGPLCYIHTTPNPVTKPMYHCGTTMVAMSTPISFYAIFNATYEYELTDLTQTSYNQGVQTKIQTTRHIPLQSFTQFAYGHTYQIRCRIKFKGIQYGWGESCILNAPDPVIGLRNQDCPKTLTSLSGLFYANNKLTVDNPDGLHPVNTYKFKCNGSESAWQASRGINLQSILGVVPQYNTTYIVYVKTTYEGVEQPWGYGCSVTTPPFSIMPQPNESSYYEIYPNPFDITFRINNSDSLSTISIMDLSGKIIETITKPDGNLGGNLATGTYYVIIEDKIYKIFKN